MEKIRINTIDWQTQFPDEVRACMSARADGECVKENRIRRIDRVLERYYLKCDKNDCFRDRAKSLVRNRMREEFDAAQVLDEAGIPVVRHIAWGREGRRTYLLTEEWSGGGDCGPVCQQVLAQGGDVLKRFVADLVGFLEVFFKHNIYHPDMHLGNVLCGRDGERFRFCLVDVYGVRHVKKLSSSQMRRMSSVVSSFLVKFDSSKRREILLPLISYMAGDAEKMDHIVLHAFRERALRFVNTGMWRVFRAGSKLTCHRASDGYWRVRRHMDIDLPQAEAALVFHQATTSSHDMRLKTDRKRLLSRYATDGFSCIVKEFVRQPWRPLMSDRRSWRSAYGVECYGLPAARYLAWKQTRGGSSYILMEDLGDCNLSAELATAVKNGDVRECSCLLSAAARIVGWMHLIGVYHRDLKTDNFIVTGRDADGVRLKLIDLDAVSFADSVPMKRMACNFQQFLNTLPNAMSRSQMLRGVVYYRQMTGFSKAQIRQILSQLDYSG